MMDMKAAVSLPSARAPKVEAPQKVDDTNHSEPSDFDRHLNQQMEQPEPSKTSENLNKSEENQAHSDNSEQEQVVENEIELIPVVQDGPVVVDEFLLETVEAVSEIVAPELAVEGSEEEPLIAQTDEQLMPLAGNVLPREAQAENVVIKGQDVPTAKVISKDQGIKINLDDSTTQASRNVHKQATLAEVLGESSEEKPLTPEFKADIKITKEAGNQLAQTRVGLNIATLAATASTQQHVPQATASAAINMQSVTASTESSANSPVMGGGIGAAVQSPAWSQGLTERVTWMLQGNVQAAELKLNPAHLGPLEVKLAIQDDKASITFVTGHAQVKEAIDTAMPRLREMLEQQGLDLADVDVSQYSDAKDEQADGHDQDEITTDMAQLDSGHEASAHESIININVDQGLSIFA